MNISRLTVSSVGEIDSKKDPKALPRKELGRAAPAKRSVRNFDEV